MLPYNDEILSQSWDWESPGGKRPAPLQTSWGMNGRREPPPPRPANWIIYVDDEQGRTVGKAETIEDGYRFLEAIRRRSGRRLVLRPYLNCEETLQTEEAERRRVRQLGL
jgi:hypothetical protein